MAPPGLGQKTKADLMVGLDIYLDSASTTSLAPEIGDLLLDELRKRHANPASQHKAGRLALAALGDAKDHLVNLCAGIDSQARSEKWQVVLTSGGTEANNLAIRGLVPSPLTPIFTSAVEHPSVLAPAAVPGRGLHRSLPVDSRGQVNIDVLDSWLRDAGTLTGRPLVCVMAGNNETGVLSDIHAVAQVCRLHNALLHCDAVQFLGKLPIRPLFRLVDSVSISAHKIHGPVGIGGLFFRSPLVLQPLLYGGGQQLGMRPGTESVALASALAKTCDRADSLLKAGFMSTVAEMRNRFESAIQRADLDAHIVGGDSPRLPHISSVAFPGLDRQALLMAFDLAGVLCSSGSACASGSSQPSHVLSAMGIPPLWVQGTIRFSFSMNTTLEEVDEASRRVTKVVLKMRESPSARRR